MSRRPRITREAIVTTAADLADREGLGEVTLARVAEVLGLHYTSLYNHVDGLDGLRRAVALVGLEELTDELWRAALGRTGTEALAAVAHAHRRYIQEHRGRYEALFIVRDPDDAELAAASLRTAEATRAVLRSFGLDAEAVSTAHHVLNGSIRGFALYEARLFPDRRAADDAFDQLVALFSDSLADKRWPNVARS